MLEPGSKVPSEIEKGTPLDFTPTPLKLYIVCLAHLGVVFCLDFSPFFFLLLFPWGMFFPLFIYLFSILCC